MIDPDEISIQLEQRPAQFANLCPNPDGVLGGYWWTTELANAAIRGEAAGGGWPVSLVYSSTVSGVQLWQSEMFPCDRSQGLNPYIWFTVLLAAANFQVVVVGYDAAGVWTGTSTAANYTAGPGNIAYAATGLPAGTKQARLSLSWNTPGTGDSFAATDFLFMTHTSAPAKTDYEPSTWAEVGGGASSIVIHRAELDVGTLTATLHSDWLDPAKTPWVRPGQGVRIAVAGQRLFTGEVTGTNTAYAPDKDGQPQEPTITLTAVDGFARLANQPAPFGVAVATQIPKVLEGKGMPWRVEGNTDQIAGGPPSYANPGASVMDQLVITCDGTNRRCYVGRDNVLMVYSTPPALPFWVTDDPAVGLTRWKYVAIEADFATDDCINAVTIARIESGVDGPETVRYGPYTDPKSVQTWGVQAAEYTIYGLTPATVASSILAASSEPGLKIRSITLQAETVDHQTWAAAIDPTKPLGVGYDGDTHATRIASVTHTLIARPDVARPVEWRVDLALTAANARRAPQSVAKP